MESSWCVTSHVVFYDGHLPDVLWWPLAKLSLCGLILCRWYKWYFYDLISFRYLWHSWFVCVKLGYQPHDFSPRISGGVGAVEDVFPRDIGQMKKKAEEEKAQATKQQNRSFDSFCSLIHPLIANNRELMFSTVDHIQNWRGPAWVIKVTMVTPCITTHCCNPSYLKV